MLRPILKAVHNTLETVCELNVLLTVSIAGNVFTDIRPTLLSPQLDIPQYFQTYSESLTQIVVDILLEKEIKKSNLGFVWHFEIVTLFAVFWCLFDGKGSGETFWERCSCILFVFMYFKYPATRRGPTSIMCFRKSGWLVYLKCKCAQRKEI